MTKQVRVRFSPSPSGSLHIGGARTALYNWAYAKKHNGTFIVRVEDTDAARSTPENEKIILDSLRWLGLDWNEGIDVGGSKGPYRQSERIDIYKFYAEKLISEKKAYRCYCTPEELKSAHEEWTKHNPKIGFKYPGICKNKPDDKNKPHVVRFAAPTDGITEFTDKAYGKISTPNIENQDWIIIRADGLPIYNFGNVVDDSLMEISLAARGADHLANTVPQLLMYQALGFTAPEFCHLGLIRGKDNEKLSKRHASVAVFEYRDKGFSPGPLLNYLAKIGWGSKDAEIFNLAEFINIFDWSGCGKTDGKWDSAKLESIQFTHLKRNDLISDKEYMNSVIPFLYKRGLTDLNNERIESVISLIRPKCKTLLEAAHELEPILKRNISIDPIAAEKFLTTPNKQYLQNFSTTLKEVESWTEENLRAAAKTWLDKNALTMKDVGQSIRVSLVGRTTGPELFQTMKVLGKEITLERLNG